MVGNLVAVANVLNKHSRTADNVWSSVWFWVWE